jgi:MYXO-CTERM domain-containing protein
VPVAASVPETSTLLLAATGLLGLLGYFWRRRRA